MMQLQGLTDGTGINLRGNAWVGDKHFKLVKKITNKAIIHNMPILTGV